VMVSYAWKKIDGKGAPALLAVAAADGTRAVAQAACVLACEGCVRSVQNGALSGWCCRCKAVYYARAARYAWCAYSRASHQRVGCGDWGRRYAETGVGLGGEPPQQQLRRPPRPASSL
jgi:Tfp pilus assembly protein PilV